MPPLTLFKYIVWRMAIACGALYLALSTLIMLVDLIESLRFASKVDSAGFGFAVRLTLMRTLGLTQAMAPFVFLFAGLWTFAQLSRRSELSVMRSAGMSIWRVIAPAAIFAAITGAAIIAIVDPAASMLTARGEQMKNDIRGKTSSLMRVFGDGIWLRHTEEEATLLINASGINEVTASLSNVIVWRLATSDESKGAFIERIDAPSATFSEGNIELHNASIITADSQEVLRQPSLPISTQLTISDFRNKAPPPETMSIWDLPRFVRLAEAAGLPTVRYNIRFHDLSSTPFKLLAMVLIAAMFSMRPARSGGALELALSAIVAGFLLYFLAEISQAMGESGAAPVALAAWTPAIVAIVVAVTGLLHIEDG